MRKLPVFLMLLFALSCASGPETPPTDEFYNVVAKQPLNFIVGRGDIDGAWARALDWITSNSKMPIQKVEADVIQTYRPPQESNLIGYTVTREKRMDGNYNVVISIYGGTKSGEQIVVQGRALAYFVQHGAFIPVKVQPQQ